LGLKRKSGSSGSVLAPELSLADVKNKFRILSKYMEILRDSGSLSGEEIENLIKNCDKVLAEGINALDKLSGGGAKPA
jgi:ElaB/YqjD/DUF883 family membrane-anchored ribosome-binding protein